MTGRRTGIGIVVGRFQVPDLHAGHRALIEAVRSRHGRTLIVLGVAPLPSSPRNPLSYETRAAIIRGTYPDGDVSVVPLADDPSDVVWSRRLDATIVEFLGTPPGSVGEQVPDTVSAVVMYQSRDGFADHYSGVFAVQTIDEVALSSGTEIRAQIAAREHDPTFAVGAIWSQAVQYPTVFTTVDMAILVDGQVLLGRKPRSNVWCFPGGFAEPTSRGDEEDVVREAKEETGLDVVVRSYVGSTAIDDWRYRSEPHAIRTRLYTCAIADHQVATDAVAGDDLEEVRWVPTSEIQIEPVDAVVDVDDVYVQQTHAPLVEMMQGRGWAT